MDQYNYDFSIVMPVYNVEEYLRESVESVKGQTIRFERIQLIMVDDGSTDSSGAICDEYKAEYPDNIIVIHKPNGGLSSARNAGLRHATGRYINFLDSDDKLARDVLEHVYRFFCKHDEEIDMCTIPLYFFDAWEGEHWQNGKFREGTRVIDLKIEETVSTMCVNASFFHRRVKNKLNFDTRLICGEDLKVVVNILREKLKLGVVAQAHYMYRRRSNESNPSLIQSSKRKKGWYLEYLTLLYEWGLDNLRNSNGVLDGFIQFDLLSDMQWRFIENYEEVMMETLDNNIIAVNEYKEKLYEIAGRFDDKYILQLPKLRAEHKYTILSKKYKSAGNVVFDGNKGKLVVNNAIVSYISNMKAVWEFISIDSINQVCTLEGYHIIYGLEQYEIIPCLEINGEIIKCEKVERENIETRSLGQRISYAVGFKSIFRLERKMNIQPAVCIDNHIIRKADISYKQFFPVSKTYKNAYSLMGDKLITVEDGLLIISDKPSNWKLFIRENFLLNEIWKKNFLGGRKAVFGRMYYHAMQLFKKRQLWIIWDRIQKADDNGEVLFDYINKYPLRDTDVVFAVSKNTPDFNRIKKVGKCVDAMSFRHKLLHLLCDVNISSQADNFSVNPFAGHHEALRDLLCHQKFVFLQHGVIQDDLSEWLNRYNKNMAGFITSSIPEHRSIVDGKYGYDESVVWNTGLPRFDRLYTKPEKIITVMPSWRKYLMDCIDGRTGVWQASATLEQSDFFHFYDELLNSDRLLSALDNHGYKLQFFPHPNLWPYINRFHKNPKVMFSCENRLYRDIYATSNLIVTDYSSAAFDFAYLKKPIIYCQFDKDKFFAGSHVCKIGYFDYERDGFGEVTYDLKNTIDLIIEYVNRNCEIKEKYLKRVETFFTYNDKNSCRRVVEKICSLR